MNSHYYYFLRHGELATKNHLAGHTDFNLTPTGYQQMTNATARLDIDRVLSSPLSRCLEFAETYSASKSLPLETPSNLKEMNFGDWDGKSYDVLWQMPKPNIGDFWQSPELYAPPNGESLVEFQSRVITWWQQMLAEKFEGNSLVVTHAGVIKQIIASVLALKSSDHFAHLKIGYGAIVTVEVYWDDNHQPWPSLVW